MPSDKMPTGETETIINRILKRAEFAQLFDWLATKVELTDLISLLLVLYEKIAGRLGVNDVFRQYFENRFVQPCDLSQRDLVALDNLIYSIIPDGFESIELSPVNPLGVNSILARVSQKNVLSTVRNVEVSADITTALALECARRRANLLRADPKNEEEVSLCSSQRSIRLQQFDRIPGFTAHFRVFGACTAGRDVGHESFEARNLTKHIDLYLDLLRILNKEGYYLEDIAVSISDIRIAETVIRQTGADRRIIGLNTQINSFNLFDYCRINLPARVYDLSDIPQTEIAKYQLQKSFDYLGQIQGKAVKTLRLRYPNFCFLFDISRIAGIGYYESLCFKITAKNKAGQRFPIVDGGLVDWTKKLLQSRKERLFISGFGSELFCRNFRS